MNISTTGKRLVAIVGATASGKSDAAVLVAKRYGGEVVNADSRLFYKGMEIGTACPPAGVLDSVPHHLVGFASPDDPYSLAQFLHSATGTISDIQMRNALPVVTGGTGQYIWGLLEGWNVPEVPPNLELRAQLEQVLAESGVDALYAQLRELDSEVASDIDPKNHRRLIRAIERIKAGVTVTRKASSDPGYDSLVIGLHVERSELHRRIAERVDRMLKAGWLDEVRKLIETGTNFASPALSAIGYRELASVIGGEMSLDEARERAIRATNRLVRHQNNWFKQTDERIKWIDVTDGDLTRVIDPVERWLK